MKVEFSSGRKGVEGGPILEGVWSPPGERGKGSTAVICHPHPLFGGSMHNNVVFGLRDGLIRADFGVLCFNFRGVGRSGGAYDDGRGEVDDVLGALEFASKQTGVSEERVFLAGYSFGGLMALYAASITRKIAGLALVSPMSPPSGFSKDGGLKPFVSSEVPFIVVYGDRDAFCPAPSVKDLNRTCKDRGRLALVSGADHFYVGLEEDLTMHVVGFFSGIAT